MVGHFDLTAWRKGFVAIWCWFQSRLVSVMPMRLGSSVDVWVKSDDSSNLVLEIPLQFW